MSGGEYENHETLGVKLDECILNDSSMQTKPNGTEELFTFNGLDGIEDSFVQDCSIMDHKDKTHKPLTFWRLLRGFMCVTTLVFTAFTMLIFFSPPTFIVLRLFSIHYSRKAIAFLFGHWLAMWPFFFEKINGTKVVFSGDCVPPRERVLLISNHRTEVDWMYIWNLALRKDRLGYIKYILKSSVRNVPIFGWGFHVLEFILVERHWKVDKPVIESMTSSFKDQEDPLWLVLFPEGTDFTDNKCIRSQEEARRDNRPVLSNVLLPKTKGFHTCLELLRDSLNAVYDVTIAYKHELPLFKDNIFGTNPAEVHVHVRRLNHANIPCSEAETASWLDETFSQKDKLLSGFYEKGFFPDPIIEDNLPTLGGLLNFLVMTVLGVFLTSLLFSSSIWIRVYATASCAYLIAATALHSRPKQVFGNLNRKRALLKSR